MYLNQFIEQMRPTVEEELQRNINLWLPKIPGGLREMIDYHMGWVGEGASPSTQGKRIRPLIMLLVNIASGGDWRAALPAAVAVEYIHNLSLIHDDIQDQDTQRHGRPTVWAKWGMPQAINAGDAMFPLGFLTICQLKETTSTEIALQSSMVLHQTCLDLMQGQFLDIAYESKKIVPLDGYWSMVQGKPAALLACCTELGALIAGANAEIQVAYKDFGANLGLAFQVIDDWLGIWGDPLVTGKAAGNDLLVGKKSFPILFGLQNSKKFAQRWSGGAVHPDEVRELADLLVIEGAQSTTQEYADQLTQKALNALEIATSDSYNREASGALHELADSLLCRQM